LRTKRCAANLEGGFPDVSISTPAYQSTRHPPRKTCPARNVILRLCTIEGSFAKPLTDDRHRSFRDDLRGWSRIAERLQVRDDVTNSRHYLIPHPNLRVLGSKIRFFNEHHVEGILEQGAYTSQGTEVAPPRARILVKLLWDPSPDAGTLEDEFLRGSWPMRKAPLRTSRNCSGG